MVPSPITLNDRTIVPEVGSIDAPVLDVAEVVALEQRIAAAGTSLYELMHRAGCFLGREVQQILQERTITPSDSRITVLCGYGNNGGDGWVAADYLRKAGDVADPCVKAGRTVTMICLKTGLCTPGSREYCGTITVAPLADIESFL